MGRMRPSTTLAVWGPFRWALLPTMLVLLGCGATAQDSGRTRNLLPNPSFEEGGGNGVASWDPRAWQGEKDGQWDVDSPGRSGVRCLSIRSELGTDAAWSTTVSVQPTTFYRLAGWIRTEALQGATGALFNVQNMQHVRTSRVGGTSDWQRVSTVFRTGEETTLEINCLFGGWGKSTGRAWYDDVALEPIQDPSGRAGAVVTIDTDAPSVAYNRMLFGGFIEHFDRQVYAGLHDPGSPLSDENGFREDVILAMRELKLSVVRWPGGCFASGYHWKDGVGSKRQPTFDVVWGAEDPNTFGTDEFVKWCALVGCEPYICTNAGNGTLAEMREWVEYCNGTEGKYAQMRAENGSPDPLHVRYWSIGNENWGNHEIGRKSAQEWGPLVSEAAELMLRVDPDLELLAAATPNRDWTLPLLASAGESLDAVAIHEYWLPCWQEELRPDYLSCVLLSDGPERTITRVIDVIEEAGYRGEIKIAFDEWNLRGWHHPGFPRTQASADDDPSVRELIGRRGANEEAQQYTMADALFSASFLNACLRHAEDVVMANIAPIVNTRGPLHVHPKGIVRRTTFHTLAMYANELEGRVGQLALESGMLVQGERFIPVLDAVATVDDSGKTWAVALVNRHPVEAVACTVKLKDVPLDGTYEAIVLSGDSPDAFNDVDHPHRVVPSRAQLTFTKGAVHLAPHSLTIVRFVVSD
jgi:alpha-L-arabinofuranosidase